MKEIKITDVPYGDYYQIIYYLKGEIQPRAYMNGNPLIDSNGNYYEITFQDMIEEIEKKHNKKISHFIMIAEFGLDGVVYRYNNYSKGEILEIGTTRGYA